MNVLSTSEQAFKLYNEVISFPSSITRAEVLKSSNIAIDGIIPMRGAQTATFHYAFEKGLPKVLKIPENQYKVSLECALYESVGAEAEQNNIPLVPVEQLRLRGNVQRSFHSPFKEIVSGIIMPPYWCTLSDIPIPEESDRILMIAERIGIALEFLHKKKWLHGDVKPGNIFVDFNGMVWLGDYGSNVQFSNIKNYTGGTPKYQLTDITADTNGKIDRVGLALTLLSLLGVNFTHCCEHEIVEIINQNVTDLVVKQIIHDLIVRE